MNQAPESQQAKIPVGTVRYLNTAPLITGLDKARDLEMIRAVPANLAPMLGSELDPDLGDQAQDTLERASIAIVSVVDLAQSKTPLTAVPVGMIGCEGPTLTVRMFSRVPLDKVTTIHADTDSHTSVMLARLLVKDATGRLPDVADYDAREQAVAKDPAGWPETVLLIGDKVVTDTVPAVRYPHQHDLGAWWNQITGLPFVYAVWACRSEDAGSEEIAHAAMILDRQRRRNRARLDHIVSAKASQAGWPDDLARRYLGELLRYEVGPREREAAQRFLDLAADNGLVPRHQITWAALQG